MSAVDDARSLIPTPSLKYNFWSEWQPDPTSVVPLAGSPRLYSIFRATVSFGGGKFRLWLEGPMLKRDGTRAQHSRVCGVDLDVPQPAWVEALVTDASKRLGRATA